MLKTQNCGELRPEHVGQEVTLAGWVHRRRDQGGLIFIDLRDRWGITQIRIDQENQPQAHAIASTCAANTSFRCAARSSPAPGRHGESEAGDRRDRSHPDRDDILNAAKTPPFLINGDEAVDEEARMRYRYLYLRRPQMQDKHHPAPPGRQVHPRLPGRARFHRNRDADPVQDDAGRRARLSRAQPPDAGHVLRAAAKPAAVEAAADGGGLRALFPDRPLLPRRRPARQPPAGIHPA